MGEGHTYIVVGFPSFFFDLDASFLSPSSHDLLYSLSLFLLIRQLSDELLIHSFSLSLMV